MFQSYIRQEGVVRASPPSAGQSERCRLLLKATWAADIKPPRRADAILEDTERSISVRKPDKEFCPPRSENTFSA
ncbi:hypothetical protein QQF64_016822 [Cirrhinus molitorella]|uniref:Uncharacterized protein n=1 Tax=Cirrhinus molitorella TaxID=172907 RepID=A0ABR3LNX1_9TELE